MRTPFTMKTIHSLLPLLGLLIALNAPAGPGHDHDHDEAAPVVAAASY